MVRMVIRSVLATLLIFMVAAPAIVGVYDATTDVGVSISDGIAVSKSSFKIYSDRDFTNSELSHDGSLSTSPNRSLEQPEINNEGTRSGSGAFRLQLYGQSPADSQQAVRSNTSGGSGAESQDTIKESYTVDDWYSGNSDVDVLFENGVAHLVYDYADGSSVDFGNPYKLDWSDVPAPDDYEQVIASFEVHENSDSSIFATPKAYAGYIGFALGKLKYLCAKAMIPANKMLINLCLSGAAVFGVSAAELPALEARLVSMTAPIVEVLAKESPLLCEEGLAICAVDTVATTLSRGAPITQMSAIAQESAIAMETTGLTLSGSSANFMTGVYQLLTTNQVSAQFLMSNSDFFMTFFSWLGADLTSFGDLSAIDGNMIGSISFNGITWPIRISDDVSLGRQTIGGKMACVSIEQASNGYFYGISGYRDTIGKPSFTLVVDENASVAMVGYAQVCSKAEQQAWYTLGSYGNLGFPVPADSFSPSNMIFSSESVLNIYERLSGASVKPLGTFDCSTGVWAGVDNVYQSGGITGGFDGQVIGADAQYDDSGNITNYGNVSVPDVSSSGYVAPNTFADALAQMNAAATQESPAQSGSPTFGQPSTIKDWLDTNKPTTPKPEEDASQDDFKVADLEKVFPFCIPWDLYYLLSALSATPKAPVIDVPVDLSAFGAGEQNLHLDLSEFDYIAQLVRIGETLAFCVGLAFVTRDLIRG